MILVDTSVWIDFFRGKDPYAQDLDHLLDTGEVALCGPIEVEIRRGLRAKRERERVVSLLEGCHFLGQPEHLWEEAGDLGSLLQGKGANLKSMDLLIAVYALAHDVAILSKDRDFETMRRSGIPLRLAGSL